jgi:hypothetical protein
MTKYRKITLQDGRKWRVREIDFAELEKHIEKQDPKKIALSTVKMAMFSPDVMHEWALATKLTGCVMSMKNVEILQSARKLIDNRIKQLRGETVNLIKPNKKDKKYLEDAKKRIKKSGGNGNGKRHSIQNIC